MREYTEPTIQLQGISLLNLPPITGADNRNWHTTIRLRPQPFGRVSYAIHFRSGPLQASLFGHLVTYSKVFEEASNWQRHLRSGRNL